MHSAGRVGIASAKGRSAVLGVHGAGRVGTASAKGRSAVLGVHSAGRVGTASAKGRSAVLGLHHARRVHTAPAKSSSAVLCMHGGRGAGKAPHTEDTLRKRQSWQTDLMEQVRRSRGSLCGIHLVVVDSASAREEAEAFATELNQDREGGSCCVAVSRRLRTIRDRLMDEPIATSYVVGLQSSIIRKDHKLAPFLTFMDYVRNGRYIFSVNPFRCKHLPASPDVVVFSAGVPNAKYIDTQRWRMWVVRKDGMLVQQDPDGDVLGSMQCRESLND